MPVQLPSLRGKCDYDVETAIKSLAAALNTLEQAPSATQLAQVRQLATDALTAASDLRQRLDRLYGACQTAGII